MSDTPRTDAARVHHTEIANRSHVRDASAHEDVGYYVPAFLFRQLERELNKMRTKYVGCEPVRQVLALLRDAPDMQINRQDLIYFCEHLLKRQECESSEGNTPEGLKRG